jgi:ribose 5-phosphate isomerase A
MRHLRECAPLIDAEQQKRQAAERAIDLVRDGMKVGLGTGSTARYFVDLLGERVRQGLSVVCVPTSQATFEQARSLGVPLTTLDEFPELDLTIDGADEIDASLRLIKGGGGALLREKIVAAASRRMVVIADGSKLVGRLGAFPLPVEVAPFGLGATRKQIECRSAQLGLTGAIELRRRVGQVFVTDGGHYILDCAFRTIVDAEALAAALGRIPGVMGHGLFLGLARAAIIASADDLRIIGDIS